MFSILFLATDLSLESTRNSMLISFVIAMRLEFQNKLYRVNRHYLIKFLVRSFDVWYKNTSTKRQIGAESVIRNTSIVMSNWIFRMWKNVSFGFTE